MTYKEFKNAVLHRIFSQSIAGEEIALTYNCQEDYVKAIPSIANEALLKLCTSVRKLSETYLLGEPDRESVYYDIYIMPDNFWRLMNGGLVIEGRHGIKRMHASNTPDGYKLLGGNQLWVPKQFRNVPIIAEYYRYPNKLEERPKDTDVLDAPPEVVDAAIIYTAAHLVQYDDAFRYASLWNEYQEMVANITEPVFIETGEIVDAYGGFGTYGW